MSEETKHLLKWWVVWFERLARTTYHIINRKAYRKWKFEYAKQKAFQRQCIREQIYSFDLLNQNDFH